MAPSPIDFRVLEFVPFSTAFFNRLYNSCKRLLLAHMDCVHAVYSFTFDCRCEFVVHLFVLTTNTYRFQLNSKFHLSVAVCNYIDVRMICALIFPSLFTCNCSLLLLPLFTNFICSTFFCALDIYGIWMGLDCLRLCQQENGYRS